MARPIHQCSLACAILKTMPVSCQLYYLWYTYEKFDNFLGQTSLSPSIQSNRLESSLSRHTGLSDPIMEHGELEEPSFGQGHPSDTQSGQQAPRDILTSSSMRISRLPRPPAIPYSPPMLDTRPSASSSTSSSSSSSHPLTTQDSPTIGSNHERGRKGSRFSFAAVSNIFMDAVRPKVSASKERGLIGAREPSVDGNSVHHHRRGRTMERGPAMDLHESPEEENEESRVRSSTERGRHVLGRILKDIDHKPRSDGWKEFKKGEHFISIQNVHNLINIWFRNIYISNILHHSC